MEGKLAHIKYILNDPTTPDMLMPVDLPPLPKGGPQFAISGYVGATDGKYTLQHQAACIYYTMVNCINLVKKYQPRFNRWAATGNLFVHPRAGRQLNAYYDRRSLKFFYGQDPVLNKVVYTSNSTDIVAHEMGHAILDAIRPDLFNVQSMEVWAFHEAFGDINAAINMLHHDKVIDILLEQTGGDLRQNNLVSKLAEEMGTAVYNVTRGRKGHTSGLLRNLFNNFVYQFPERLPRNSLDNQLSSGPHNFSRVFSGAWYDILCGMYEELYKIYLSKEKALKYAVEILTEYTYKAISIAANTLRFFDAVARAMILVDKNNDRKFAEILNRVFLRRKILSQPFRPMLALDFDSYKEWTQEGDEIYDEGNKSITERRIEVFSLPQHMMNVECPADTYYEFCKEGYCVDVVAASNDELVEHADVCVEYLLENNMIRPDKFAPFEINQEGSLVRTHFACGCKNFI